MYTREMGGGAPGRLTGRTRDQKVPIRGCGGSRSSTRRAPRRWSGGWRAVHPSLWPALQRRRRAFIHDPLPGGIFGYTAVGRPHVVDVILSGEIQMVINTTVGRQAIADSRDIRRSAFLHNIPYQTTIPGAWAVVQAIQAAQENPRPQVCSLQELYKSEVMSA